MELQALTETGEIATLTVDEMGFPIDMPEEIKAAIIDLNTGRITYPEYQRISYMVIKRMRMPELLNYVAGEEWEKFVDLTLACFEVMPEAFTFYDRLPDNLKYNFAIDAYTHHGDSIPAVRQAVRTARRYGKPDLPPEIAAAETITIYRAGEEPIDKAKYRISWTTDYDVAAFFFGEYIHRHANHIYKGTIRTADIIAYVDDREEKEVMQYRKVFDISDITPDE